MKEEEVKNPCDNCESETEKEKEEPISWICEDCKA
jgi:ribosomal protein L37AE/L43A